MSTMKLRPYLQEKKITISAFAALIDVSVPAVHRYVAGERFPHERVLKRIVEVTDGAVQPADFFSEESAA